MNEFAPDPYFKCGCSPSAPAQTYSRNHSRRFKTVKYIHRLGGFGLWIALCAAGLWAQGFSGMSGKKTIILHRKLPAAVKLNNISKFNVVATAKAKDQEDVAQALSDILVTELQKDDKRLQEDKTSPELTITATITHYEIPPPQTSTRTETELQKGHLVNVPKQYYRLIGELEVAYQARDKKSGHMIDSQNLTAKYNREFESGTNEATDKSLGSKVASPFKKLAGKKDKEEESDLPPTPLELRQKLIHQVVIQIATRLVSTDEAVEVLLAHDKQFDSANKLAESGLWSRYLETLETMTPLADPKQDAYRLYNIGVANEALAYQSEDRKVASKFLQEAAINYGKAIDARPDEKYFIEPQNRIETAVAYYKKLDEPQHVVEEKPVTAPAPASSSPTTASKGSSSKSSTTSKTTGSKSSASGSGGSSSTAASASGSPALPALTNQKVIDMLKGGVDEENIIATIREAKAVKFDLSPDGQISLAQNGVKGKVLAAMRDRSHQPNHAKSSQ